MNRFFILVLVLIIANHEGKAQYISLRSNISIGYVGFTSGYQKTGPNAVNTKHQMRLTCGSENGHSGTFEWNGQHFPNGYYDSVMFTNNYISAMNTTTFLANFGNNIIMLHNADSTSKVSTFRSIGIRAQYAILTDSFVGQKGSRVLRGCNTCALPSEFRTAKTINYVNELVSDTSVSFTPLIPVVFTVDSPAAAAGITLFHGQDEVLSDSISYRLKNIISHYNSGSYYPVAVFYSRIFRFFDYASINSPEASNRAMIVALKNRPQTYSFGFVDKEHDSISVVSLHMKVSYTNFNPALPEAFAPSQISITPAQQLYFKHALTDSTQLLDYKPGYSATNPFGPGSSFVQNPTTGDFTFTAPDTGYYYLAFRITEYRNGRPLGDIMTYRVAWVINDTLVTLPTLSHPKYITGATYDSTAGLLTICPGSTAAFTVSASSTLAGSAIGLENNFRLAALGSASAYTGHGSGTPQLTFSWTPTAADTGYRNIFITALDTACGAGHALVPVNRSFRILVRGRLNVQSADSAVCAGATAILGVRPGYSAAGPYTWAVVPGGDPFLPCTTCSSISVHPTITTKYVLTATGGNCTQRDTFTVRILPKPIAGAITATLVTTGGTQYIFTAPGAQNATSYSWLFGSNGASGTGNSIIYTYPANGTFTVRLIARNSCGADTVYKTMVTGTGVPPTNTAIGNTGNEEGISIYPNPASPQISIKMSRGKLWSYSISAANGAVVVPEHKTAGNREAVIDVSKLAAGIYTLRLQTANGLVIRQVVVSR